MLFTSKTVNESLRYAYHMNMQQFKILLFIKDYSTAHERPLTIQTLVIKEHCNKAMMLKYLAQLYAMHWISKSVILMINGDLLFI